MNKSPIFRWGATLAMAVCMLSAPAQVTLDIDAGRRGPAIGERHYGLFFEEINHAGDGGLYAELIHNRSFEDNAANPDKWWAVGEADMSVTTEGLLNAAQGHALRLQMHAPGDGVRNEGFWGIDVVEGRVYKLSFWIRAEEAYEGVLTCSLQAEDGTSLGATEIPADVNGEWVKLEAEITATGDDPKGWFVLTGDTPGTVVLDVVSLFPPTWKGRANGCRPDLAEMLAAMKPGFVRFPGGCYVEGVWGGGSTNRFEWKKTIGPIEERPGHMNQNWGYRVTDGMGFHEMLQLTEDLGAEPLFVVNMGMGHGWAEDYRQIDEYIQEALDAIEYCNGDAQTTKWGAERAKNGHPEPFNLRLIEIGNENYNFSSENNSDQSDHYAERYIQFYEAIREKYPEVTIIGNVEAWGTDDPSWRNPYPVDVVDEHYYRNPSWFEGKYNKYDTYSRSAHKIYVGEYAVTQDFGVQGHLEAALGEAVFMLGMENNSDVCVMNSYAPIFANVNNYNWRPDMIQFDSRTSYGTPSYYVQQLFPNNVGKENVEWTEENNTVQSSSRRVGLSTWSTTVTFDNVRVTGGDGTEIFSDDFSSSNSLWQAGGGRWEVSGGQLHQEDVAMMGSVYVCDIEAGDDYTFEVEATKNSGAEGFLIAFNYVDDKNYCWWNLGGWNNTQHGVEVCSDGVKSTVASVAGALETGRTYRIRIRVEGTRVRCYLDDELLHDFTLPVERKVYVSSSIDDEAGVLYVKLVNPHAEAQAVTVNLANASVTGGSMVELTSGSNKDENSLDNPRNVVPRESTLDVAGQRFTVDMPAWSLRILRLDVTDVEIVEEEPATLPEPLVQYSFEAGKGTDDSGTFQGTLQGGASVVAMEDGNHALYTGADAKGGYLDMGADMARATLGAIEEDYSVSVDIALAGVGNLAQACWAYGLADGTDKYMGLVGSTGNMDWSFTAKGDAEASFVASRGGLGYGRWHNLTYVQEGGMARFYVDGRLVAEQETSFRPADIAEGLTEAYLGRSPFENVALMAETYMDNFRIYGQALDAAQVEELYAQVEGLSMESGEADLVDASAELEALGKKFGFLHATVALPAETDGGVPLAWAFEPGEANGGRVTLSGNTLSVNSLPQGVEPVMAGTLKVSIGGDASASWSCPVRLAPDDNRHGYLYCFMNAGNEITNFALGTKEDRGHVFNVLLDGGEVFDTEALAGIEGGTRDAYLGRGEESDGYFITTTDMKQHASGVWNNHGINLLRSKDLIHWEGTTFDFTKGKSIFSDPEAVTGVYDTDEEYARINRVWAPQFVWDKDYGNGEGAYLVYYSILSTNEGDTRDRIFYSYADREFKTLTQPRLFFDPGVAVIDADIVYNPYDGLYHMFYKREGASGTDRGIYEATSDRLVGGTWTDVAHVTNEGSELVEAPTAVRRINEDGYNLYYMRYSGGSAYKYCETDHLGLNISYSTNVGGTGAFQHGSVMTVTEEEYVMLQAWSDVRLLLPEIISLKEESGSAVFDEAIRQAESALDLTTVAELASALPAARAALMDAAVAYAEEESGEGETDLTFLLKNPGFDEYGSGWSGTAFSAAGPDVAEFFNTTFDTYQVLRDMPAGTYRFLCQGFYRDGDYVVAYPARQNGTEQLRAVLYVNDAAQPFMSLFDESAPYTYSPYTYPDNVATAHRAFNIDGEYADNEVEYKQEQRGDLRLGIAKDEYQTHDWTCFDNFRLYFKALPTAIREMTGTSVDGPVDVYTVSGVKVRSGVASGKAVDGLAEGIYIVGGRKVVVSKH